MPVVAELLDLGTGGGYFLACGCDRIVAAPGSVVGGIGVVLNTYFLELAMEQWNAFGAVIKSGARIDMGTPLRKMNADEKAMLTAMAEEYHANFKQVVVRSRPRIAADAPVFDGRVMAPRQALEAGLIDQVGDLGQAIDCARQLANVPADAVVLYRPAGRSATSEYDVLPNRPIDTNMVPINIPGLAQPPTAVQLPVGG